MMKLRILTAFITLGAVLLPGYALAANPIVQVGTPPTLVVCGTETNISHGDIPGGTNHPCTFADVMILANQVIKFIFYIAVPLALIGFSWAGWLYLTSAGDTGKVKKAHDVFKGMLWGFIWICVAYALVYTIVSPLLNKGYQLFQLG